MKKLLLSLCFGFSLLNIQAQCSETLEPKVLLIGDSWAFFMNADQTFNQIFTRWGMSNYRYISNSIVSENGAQTDDFLTQTKQDEIARLLNANPSIEVVHVSLGGNDVLGGWDTTFTAGRTDTLRAEVETRLRSLFDFIKNIRPELHILWSGYCYTNFNEVISTSPLGSSHPFYGTWSGMKFPSMRAINDIQNLFSNEIEAYTLTDPRVSYVKATGLMQYVFGQTTPLAIPPGGTYPPLSVSLPYGNPDYPSPVASMRDYGFAKDCFHLSPKGYQELISYHTQKFYHKFLMDDLYLLADNSTKNGSVTSTGSVQNKLELGGNASGSTKLVLNFNTTGMADTTLAKASIFLRRKTVTGTTPFSGTIHIELKNGNFGSSADVEASDFNEPGDVAGSVCIFGSPFADGHWSRLELPAQALPLITNSANTQIVLSAPDFADGVVEFYDGSDPDFAPVLNLKYGANPVASVNASETMSFRLFPNPASNTIQVETFGDALKAVSATNILGKTVALPLLSENRVDLNALSAGIYQLNVTTALGKGSKRFIKE